METRHHQEVRSIRMLKVDRQRLEKMWLSKRNEEGGAGQPHELLLSVIVIIT